MAAVAVTVLAVAGLAGLVAASVVQPEAPPVNAAASQSRPSTAQTAQSPEIPPPAPAVDTSTPPPATGEQAPATPLHRGEIREVQTRLLGFGFNPGRVDGAVGRATAAAALRYRQERSLEPSDIVDRPLLEQLRQDPSPSSGPANARRNKPHGAPSDVRSSRTAQRDPGPFPRVGRWLDSLTR